VVGVPDVRVRPFSPIRHPDFNEVVVHFTGRRCTSDEASRRLLRVVGTGSILATVPYGNDLGAACFTESTARGVSWLIAERHFVPFGIAFTKTFLFARGGAPAIIIRGDEWNHVRQLPPQLRARAIRLWPGAMPEPGEWLPSHLQSRSEWLGEREWRVPADAGTPALTFETADIAFLVVPDGEWVNSKLRALVKAGGKEAGRRLASVRWIALSPTGEVVANNGVKLSPR
jgi:hypothetical protein